MSSSEGDESMGDMSIIQRADMLRKEVEEKFLSRRGKREADGSSVFSKSRQAQAAAEDYCAPSPAVHDARLARVPLARDDSSSSDSDNGDAATDILNVSKDSLFDEHPWLAGKSDARGGRGPSATSRHPQADASVIRPDLDPEMKPEIEGAKPTVQRTLADEERSTRWAVKRSAELRADAQRQMTRVDELLARSPGKKTAKGEGEVAVGGAWRESELRRLAGASRVASAAAAAKEDLARLAGGGGKAEASVLFLSGAGGARTSGGRGGVAGEGWVGEASVVGMYQLGSASRDGRGAFTRISTGVNAYTSSSTGRGREGAPVLPRATSFAHEGSDWTEALAGGREEASSGGARADAWSGRAQRREGGSVWGGAGRREGGEEVIRGYDELLAAAEGDMERGVRGGVEAARVAAVTARAMLRREEARVEAPTRPMSAGGSGGWRAAGVSSVSCSPNKAGQSSRPQSASPSRVNRLGQLSASPSRVSPSSRTPAYARGAVVTAAAPGGAHRGRRAGGLAGTGARARPAEGFAVLPGGTEPVITWEQQVGRDSDAKWGGAGVRGAREGGEYEQLMAVCEREGASAEEASRRAEEALWRARDAQAACERFAGEAKAHALRAAQAAELARVVSGGGQEARGGGQEARGGGQEARGGRQEARGGGHSKSSPSPRARRAASSSPRLAELATPPLRGDALAASQAHNQSPAAASGKAKTSAGSSMGCGREELRGKGRDKAVKQQGGARVPLSAKTSSNALPLHKEVVVSPPSKWRAQTGGRKAKGGSEEAGGAGREGGGEARGVYVEELTSQRIERERQISEIRIMLSGMGGD